MFCCEFNSKFVNLINLRVKTGFNYLFELANKRYSEESCSELISVESISIDLNRLNERTIDHIFELDDSCTRVIETYYDIEYPKYIVEKMTDEEYKNKILIAGLVRDEYGNYHSIRKKSMHSDSSYVFTDLNSSYNKNPILIEETDILTNACIKYKNSEINIDQLADILRGETIVFNKLERGSHLAFSS